VVEILKDCNQKKKKKSVCSFGCGCEKKNSHAGPQSKMTCFVIRGRVTGVKMYRIRRHSRARFKLSRIAVCHHFCIKIVNSPPPHPTPQSRACG
jgi:hypothetical protein